MSGEFEGKAAESLKSETVRYPLLLWGPGAPCLPYGAETGSNPAGMWMPSRAAD